MSEDSEFDDVCRLLTEVAWERRDEVTELLGRYRVGFRRSADASGFKLANTYGQVLYNDRTMLQLYLLSFMAWRALRAYSGLIVLLSARGESFDLGAMSDLPGQQEADQATDRLAATLADIRGAWGIADVPWPEDVPVPTLGRHADVEDQATQEVALLATAYVLLHEIHHAMLEQEGTAPGGWEEELLCDAFARNFMLARVDQYAAEKRVPASKVLNKRAMGIALANGVLAAITPPELWSISGHPPVADRLTANYAGWPEDECASVWVYMACLLAARLRREGRTTGAVVFETPRGLCASLTRLLT